MRPSIRGPSAHGGATRQHILAVAGPLFAAGGYEGITSKEVCTAAGANLAAVNYHFGSREGLYAAVLIEAHRRLLSRAALEDIAAGPGDARAKLGRIIDGLLEGMGSEGWHLRLFMRELLAPTPTLGAVLLQEVAPKLAILTALLAEAGGMAADEPRVARCFLSAFAPCMLLLLADTHLLSRVMGDVWQDPAALSRHLKTFALAGLDAIAAS